MAEIPVEVGGARVVKHARLSAAVEATGATRHMVAEDPVVPFAALVVGRYEEEPGYYLFSVDATDEVVTDTWHESLDDALQQAEFEYSGLAWVDVSDA